MEEENKNFSISALRPNKKPIKRGRVKHDWVKPWTTNERLFVVLVFIATILASAILAITARAWKLPNLPRVGLPRLSWFTTKPYEYEGTSVVAGVQLQQLQTDVVNVYKSKVENQSGVYGLYFVDLSSGYSFGVYENDEFMAASLIKLPVMVLMLQKGQKGELDLEKTYTLQDKDKVAGAGSLFGKPAGYEITYRNLVKLMGKQSDNTAFNVCRKLLGDGAIDAFAKKIGLRSTTIGTNTTTPYDIGILFKELYDGNLLNTVYKNELYSNLTDTLYENWLVAGVPDNIVVAHKYGAEVHVVNDGGIVFADKPYVLVILTKGIVESSANTTIPELSSAIYALVSARN